MEVVEFTHMGEMIEFKSNGGTATGYLATPANPNGGALVVVQEWWGLVPHIKDLCDRFAAEGYYALAPDLYGGKAASEPDEAGKFMMALEVSKFSKDLSGAADAVMAAAGSDKCGAVGFCMGGGLALVLAAQRPDAVTAVAPFYGVIAWPEAAPDYSGMTAAVQGHYAEFDDFMPPESSKALGVHLRELGKSADIYVYDGTHHAFFNDTRPEVYDAEASSTAWNRLLPFFAEHVAK